MLHSEFISIIFLYTSFALGLQPPFLALLMNHLLTKKVPIKKVNLSAIICSNVNEYMLRASN